MAKSKNEKISESMLGNNNAEVWTLEEAEKLFDKALEIVSAEEIYIVAGGIKVNGFKYDFIGELIRDLRNEFQDKKVYRDLLNNYLPTKFPELKSKYNQILNEIETNCFHNAKKGNINTAVGIVNLKSNHKWTDRTQNDVTSDGEKISITPIQWVKNE